MPFLSDIDSEVQLLVCNNCCQESQARKDIMNWCVKNHFELIELNPSDENEDKDDMLIKDVKGYERIIQALQSHTWANLIIKGISQEDNSKEETENVQAAGDSRSATCAPSQETSKTSKKIEVDNDEILLEDKLVADVLSGEDPGGSFEALFSRFASMKDYHQ
ncbi:alpha- and gamma-adaptin-binding protein p34-like [Stegodyphus dumicola]|uniref:alpha- and gamma-adaptin-binding protein p34-like n=1 Tax=Stegodyphus dumicola TaxID=202533 RepID=UPI0015ADCFC5|nr:alpha- and gamma-adaptin-binding protein p34-like [Stegodyphus dumicola]